VQSFKRLLVDYLWANCGLVLVRSSLFQSIVMTVNFLFFLSSSSYAQQIQNISWIPTGTGNWSVPANWFGRNGPGGGPPNGLLAASVQSGGTAEITTPASAFTLTIGGAGTPGGTVELLAGVSLTLGSGLGGGGTLTVGQNGTFVAAGNV